VNLTGIFTQFLDSYSASSVRALLTRAVISSRGCSGSPVSSGDLPALELEGLLQDLVGQAIFLAEFGDGHAVAKGKRARAAPSRISLPQDVMKKESSTMAATRAMNLSHTLIGVGCSFMVRFLRGRL